VIQNFNLSKILKTALKHGGDFAELYADSTEGLQIIAEEKKIDKISPTIDRGVGIRILYGDKTAYGFTNDISEKSLLELATSIAEGVKGNLFDKNITLKTLPPHLQFSVSKNPEDFKMDYKRDLVLRGEQAAWAADARIKQVKVLYGEILKEIFIANSYGQTTQEKRHYTLYFVQVVAGENGSLQTGYYPVGGVVGLELLEENSPELIAQKATSQALMMLKARKAPAGTMTVVLSSEAGGTMVHEAVGHGLEADLACQGLSVYHKKLGEKIAGDPITVVDDATLPNSVDRLYLMTKAFLPNGRSSSKKVF